MSPYDQVPDAPAFCPWCGLLLAEDDYEDDGRFNSLLRCPQCAVTTCVGMPPYRIPYDYARCETTLQQRLKKADDQSHMTLQHWTTRRGNRNE